MNEMLLAEQIARALHLDPARFAAFLRQERARQATSQIRDRLGGLTVKQAYALVALDELKRARIGADIEPLMLKLGYQTDAVHLNGGAVLGDLSGRRGFVKITDQGYTLTKEGRLWLKAHKHIILNQEHATTPQIDAIGCLECGAFVLDAESHQRHHEMIADLRDATLSTRNVTP